MVGVAARVASTKAPWLVSEEESIPDLTNHIAGLEAMLTKMQLRVRQTQEDPSVLWSLMILFELVGVLQVPVAFWSVEATQPAWAEAQADLEGLDDSLEDLMKVEIVSNHKMAPCFQAPCCGLGCIQ